MRALLALIAVAAVACGAPVAEPEPRVPCATDADCPDGTICGKGSGRTNSAKPTASLVAVRPAECFPPCKTEITDDCALPACPTSGHALYSLDSFKEGGNRPEGWHEASGTIRESCDGFDLAMLLTCGNRSGILDVTGSIVTTRAFQFGVVDQCDYLRGLLDDGAWWPWSF